MISSFVRRRRLASELLALRERRGMSGQELADAIGVARQRVSRLENGRVRPDLDEVIRILRVFNIEGDEWSRLIGIARDAQEHGWWERYSAEMGTRQALCANLEAGAMSICQYQITLLPGLLQTAAYTQARIAAEGDTYPPPYDPERAMQARAHRQQLLDRPGGPRYRVVIDELAVRRFAAPTAIVADQLRHIVELAGRCPGIDVHVLPIAARLPGYLVARTAFTIYGYPEDPPVVLVDTITSDLVVTDAAQCARYEHLYRSLTAASLTAEGSLAFLADMAQTAQQQQQMGVPA